METLDGTEWDVLIAGTGLKQSLLALALSRSNKKVLHVDSNDYYGGNQAALSLAEAEAWAQNHASSIDDDRPTAYTDAAVERNETAADPQQTHLGSSRAYSLALAPHLIFTRSNILSALVSSRVHGQLEFQAVGSWFVFEEHATGGQVLVKVPSGREDIFQDTGLDLRTKRSMMKFIRFITDPESQASLTPDERNQPTPDFLQQKFGIPEASQPAVHTLTLSPNQPKQTTVDEALPNIARHLSSIGLFGAGFNALVPKWGGLAEIAQVACRAGAVGGGVYVLNRGLKSINTNIEGAISARLSQDEAIRTKWVVGTSESLPTTAAAQTVQPWSRCICIVSSPLNRLFPPTSEGGVTPAGAVIRALSPNGLPVYVFAHSAETGECPPGQCVLYASIACDRIEGYSHLRQTLSALLSSFENDPAPPKLLWTLYFQQHALSQRNADTSNDNILSFEELGPGLALEDATLDEVRQIWHTITGEPSNEFMKFEARTGTEDQDEDDEEVQSSI